MNRNDVYGAKAHMEMMNTYDAISNLEIQDNRGDTVPNTRQKILETAAKCVCGDREQDYGIPENNFACIASLWEVYMRDKCVSANADLTILPEDVAVMLILLKVARIASGHAKADNWVDIAGYAACGGEIEASCE